MLPETLLAAFRGRGAAGAAGLVVVVAAAAGGEEREYADEQREQNEASLRHSRASSLSVPS